MKPHLRIRIGIIICVTAGLFVVDLFVAGCSSAPKDKPAISKTDEKVPPESTPENTLKNPESLMKLKQKILSKRLNPVLISALNNSLFNSDKWLKSDIAFQKRTNPKNISAYDPIIKKMSRRYGFDWRLIAAQIYTESNFKNEAQSRVGALGLMQVIPSTAKFMGFDPKSMIKPEFNIAVGCMYNQRMHNLWGNQVNDYNRLAFSLASYNAGRKRVLKSYNSKEGRTTWESVHPQLPEETQSYVHKIYLKNNFYKSHVLP